MTSRLSCPLASCELIPMKLLQVEEIESHTATDSCSHQPLKNLIFKGPLEGTTPLLLACHYGDLEAVMRIVDIWAVDVQKTAKYYTDPSNYLHRGFDSKIDKATPMFVAALNGHSKIVRYLIEKGADVSSEISFGANMIYDGLTPLQGTVCKLLYYQKLLSGTKEDRNKIVQLLLECGADPSALPSNSKIPIWMRELCSADITTRLINHGMNLNQRNPETGETVLHHWASLPKGITEKDSLVVVKLLLEKDANLVIIQDNSGLTPILRAANGRGGVCPNLNVLNFLLEREEFSRMEKIEAMELAGAVILSNTANASQFQQAFEYWRRALKLRLDGTIGSNSTLNKIPLKLESVAAVEWVTSDQLERVIHHPHEYVYQAFLVQMRIFYKKSWGAFKSASSVFNSLNYARIVGLRRFLNILCAILEIIPRFSVIVKGLWETTIQVVESLLMTLSTLERDSPELLDIEIVQISLDFILATDQFDLEDSIQLSNYKNYTRTLCRLVSILARLPQFLVNEDIMGTLFELVRRDKMKGGGPTLLHIICREDDRIINNILATARLLLQAGADPNATDASGDTPLHFLARMNGEWVDPTARSLFDSGARLDRVNKYGKMPVDVWIDGYYLKNRHQADNQRRVGWNDLPSWFHNFIPKLSWLSARAVSFHKIPCLRPEDLPATLKRIVNMH